MGWLDRAINRGVRQGVETALDDFCKPGGGLDEVIERCVWKHLDESLPRTQPLTHVGFIWALRLCFRKHGCTVEQATDLANSTLRQYLADEKIRFGDPDYAWTRPDAEVLAEEYEFRHWEAAAP